MPQRDLETPMIPRRQQRPVNLFRPFSGRLVTRRRRDSPLTLAHAPTHERIRNHRVKNRVDTICIDVISDHYQFRLSFRSSSVEYWFEKRTGMCGASRSSACELDATEPKVNRGASGQLPGQRWIVGFRMCEARRFAITFRDLLSISVRGTGTGSAAHHRPILCKCDVMATVSRRWPRLRFNMMVESLCLNSNHTRVFFSWKASPTWVTIP